MCELHLEGGLAALKRVLLVTAALHMATLVHIWTSSAQHLVLQITGWH